MSETFKAHLISKVLLGQFTRRRLVNQVRKVDGYAWPVRPKAVAYVEHRLEDMAEAETNWQKTEVIVKRAFKKLREGNLLSDPEALSILKRFMAIHYVRSGAFYELSDKLSEDYIMRIISKVVEFEGRALTDAETAFVYKTWNDGLERQIGDLMIRLADNVTSFMDSYDLEVGLAAEGSEFIIGDVPVLTIKKGGSMGVLNGVSIDQSDGVGMPLTPRHFIALKSNAKTAEYVPLSATEVASANQKSKKQARIYYYERPLS